MGIAFDGTNMWVANYNRPDAEGGLIWALLDLDGV